MTADTNSEIAVTRRDTINVVQCPPELHNRCLTFVAGAKNQRFLGVIET